MDRLPSRLRRKGGYPHLLRKRLTLLPGLVRRSRHPGHRNAPPTIICESIEMPNSSGLGTPPSRTLLLSGRGLPDNPTSRLSIRRKSLERLINALYHNPTPLNHTITLYTAIILAITSIPGLYCKIGTL